MPWVGGRGGEGGGGGGRGAWPPGQGHSQGVRGVLKNPLFENLMYTNLSHTHFNEKTKWGMGRMAPFSSKCCIRPCGSGYVNLVAP